jgi:membrane protein
MDMETLLKALSTIGEKFIYGTVRGLNWFFAQMLVEAILYVIGILFVDSMILRWCLVGSSIFVFAYTMIFNWFYVFIPIKHFIKTFWLPYLIYVGIWEIGISYDWSIQDRILIYFMPLYGAFFTYSIWKLTMSIQRLSTLSFQIKRLLGEITLEKVLVVQGLGITLTILVEYYNLHPISTLLGGNDKWDFTSTLVWIILVIFPAIYAIYYKVKKVWLPTSIAVFPFILIGILAMVIFVKDFV